LAVLFTGCRPSAESVEPVVQEAPRFAPVELDAWATGKVEDGLPQGVLTFQGVTYKIGPRPLQVGSRSFPAFPKAIEGIAVGQTCRAIHFLHATQGGSYQQPGHAKHENDGVEVGQYVIRYADGTQATQPLIYGEHLRDWWDWDGNPPTAKCQPVWMGEDADSRRNQRKLRLYWAVWENPQPETPVRSIDLVSANAKAAPFCVAVTLEPNES
jgi:hypothetical protein